MQRLSPGRSLLVLLLLMRVAVPAAAQSNQPLPPPPEAAPEHDHAAMLAAQEHDHAAMSGLVTDGSGTSVLPATSPMYEAHRSVAGWSLMAHGNLFVQYLHESGARGGHQTGSINWFMLRGQHAAGAGRVGFSAMASLEPWTVRGCGYPDLLASGESCGGEAIHDRQHPHDLVMELAATYDRPLTGTIRWQVYGGPAGEPALGPVAFPHRPSALVNPLAPIAHHWLDSTHITFGVVTTGVSSSRWKVEASAFNGREPDEARKDFDLGALDSISGRVSFAASRSVVLQVSAGHIEHAETGQMAGEPDRYLERVTASAVLQHDIGAGSWWANTIAWGRNVEMGEATHALLLESTLSWRDRDAFYGRVEAASKDADDLDLHGYSGAFDVAKFQGGYTRTFTPAPGLQVGIGASLSAGIVPESLRAVYGGRVNRGAAVYLVLRPSRHAM